VKDSNLHALDALAAMELHHRESIRNLTQAFQAERSVRALILGGSLAHGFARPDSDIDVAIVVSAKELARRRAEGRLHYNNRAFCTYPEGYVDGKYIDEAFLRLVAKRGSDPARYAFQDARILFSRFAGLERTLADIVRYPVNEKARRIARFASQLLGWRWYFAESVRQHDEYLRILAAQKVVLFSCRIVLAANELLYPYHKWMLRVTLSAPRQPTGFAASIGRILSSPSYETIDAHCRATLALAELDHDAVSSIWPTHFMEDTELRWMNDTPAIDDW
jgi:predicted nucleotidyltransferase